MKENLFKKLNDIIILEVSKQGENKVSRNLNERKPLLITNQHIIRLGCTHSDEMPVEIKGQLFPTLMLSVPCLRRTDPHSNLESQRYPRIKGIHYSLSESSSSMCPYVNGTWDLECIVCQLL